MAMAIVLVAGMASVQALVLTNHRAAAMRTLNNARAIVQRNIDAALGVPFSSNSAAPAILAIGSGQYDDDGDGVLPVPIVVQRNGTTSVVSGTLTRTVAAEANTAGADIRRITFTVNYTYRGKAYAVSMTTLRSTD
jgi:hypothetical protein